MQGITACGPSLGHMCTSTLANDLMNHSCAGGQAKRVNIGIALVAQPRVLFLDEPTSGLDSYTSFEASPVAFVSINVDYLIMAGIV